MSFRVGQGVDVHRFRSGRPLRLCGVEIPGATGLEGHSDADVALHAVTDAVLGAIAAGDLGDHFPETDTRWRNADSTVFLTQALHLARGRGFCPVPGGAPRRIARSSGRQGHDQRGDGMDRPR